MLDNLWIVLVGALASLGGGAVIVKWFINRGADVFADRLSKRYELKLNKDLAKFNAYLGVIQNIPCEILNALDLIIEMSPSSDGTQGVDNSVVNIDKAKERLKTAKDHVYGVLALKGSRDLIDCVSSIIDELEIQLNYIETADSFNIKCKESIYDSKNKFIEDFPKYENQITD